MTMLKNSRMVRTVSIDDLKPYKNNPHRYPKKLLQKIKALIDRHDQIPIIPVTSDLTIIGFEEWWVALKKAGRAEVTVQVLTDFTAAEASTVRLALGRLPLDARLDPNRLRAELAALQVEGIDLDLTGFEQAEIDSSFELDMPRGNVTENLDAIPKRQNRAISRLGDIFQLGDHRVGCGDARDQLFVDHLCGGREAQACISDLPYKIRYSEFGFGKNRDRQGDFIEASVEMSEDELYSLLHESMNVLRSASSPSGLLFLFMDWRSLLQLLTAGKLMGLPLLNICVWAKENGGMGGLYRSAQELCAVFKAGNEPHLNNVELGKYGRNRSNIWWGYTAPTDQHLLGGHPTVKPVAMLADIMRDSTRRGQLVLDTFLGSGSTLIAAEETGRTCVGTELDPYYLDVTIRRWEALTGQDAIHIGTGQRFDDMAQHLLTHQGS